MKTLRSRQRGAVALELALSLPVLLTMLTYLLFYGRVLYNYEVAQKAARDSARYLSSVPAMNLKNPVLAAHEVNLANAMIQSQLSAIAPAPGGVVVVLNCDSVPCTMLQGNTPSTVTAIIAIDVQNGLNGYAGALTNLQVRAVHSMRYVGQ
jgi:Flp pilus assembly protein TadG